MRLQTKLITFTLRVSIKSVMNTTENPITPILKASDHMSATPFSYINNGNRRTARWFYHGG